MNRRLAAIAVVTLGAVTACRASPPPARELANELIDTLDVSDEVKACMHDQVAGFALSEQDAQGFTGLDDVAAKAAAGEQRAIQIMNEFSAALATCN